MSGFIPNGDFEDPLQWILIFDTSQFDVMGMVITSVPSEIIAGAKTLRARVRNQAIGPTITGGEIRIPIDGLEVGKTHHIVGTWYSTNIVNNQGSIDFLFSETVIATFNATSPTKQAFDIPFVPMMSNGHLRIIGPDPGSVGGRDYYFDDLDGQLPVDVVTGWQHHPEPTVDQFSKLSAPDGTWQTQASPTNDQFTRLNAPGGIWTPNAPPPGTWSKV